MLFDNAKLQPGETILVHAGGSGIGTAAIQMAKAIGCTVITTVGDDDKIDEGQGARRRSRHQLPHRSFRRRSRASSPTRRASTSCSSTSAPRRFNGSLLVLKRGGRLVTCGSTSGPTDHDQPDAAVPAAVPDHRLVRRHRCATSATASTRWRRGMTPVIDTELAAGRSRARARAAGKPAGVRQDRRHVLGSRDGSAMARGRTPDAASAVRRQHQRCASLASSRVDALPRRPAVRSRRPPANVGAGAACGPRPAGCRNIEIGRANLRAAFPEKSRRRDRAHSCAASGTISAASAPSSRISTALGLRPGAPASRAHHRFSTETHERFDPAARRRQAGADLRGASGELGTAGGRRRAPTASRAPCSIARPNIARCRRRDHRQIRADQHGRRGRDRPRRAGPARRRRWSAARMSACWSTSISTRGVDVTFFGRRSQGQSADRAAGAPRRLPDPRRARHPPARTIASASSSRRGNPAGARRRRQDRRRTARCRRSPT